MPDDSPRKFPAWLPITVGIICRGAVYVLSGWLCHYAIIEKQWHGWVASAIDPAICGATLPIATACWSWWTIHRVKLIEREKALRERI